ncbi:MAG: DDE-type integrase/transposase/recombinase [Candidatus Thiodiazotropha endolucinida]|nr:DDE-type integrase/transposase/recombinase [Candidatus Thiodiazotropha endolucinida]
MLEQGTVEPSDSPWSAPICLVKKKDGSCRFCIDFRKLNSVTLKDAYPLPRIDDTLESLSGSLWFSTLDLASGYWQIRMSKTSKSKTAFVVPHRGLFHFNVMPFGLTNAPASFQRLMEKVLLNLTPNKCLCYLDDIIIVGKTFQEALENLKLVFHRLREANLKLKPKKCSLFQTKVTYLGHVVSEDGIACDPSKIEAIENWPAPTNKTEVRSALGLIGYYRKFIPQFAETAKPLTRLTRKNVKFAWDNECEKAFLSLKSTLTCAPVLSFPREDGVFIVDTDASLWGIGGVLSQEQDGIERVIAYASKTLNPAQQNYCTTKRELLAVVTFMRHFKHYLLGRKFIIRTDHAPLIWLKNFKEPEGLMARWISIIETFDYELRYRPGRQHKNADALSRKPKRKCPNNSCHDCFPEVESNKVLGEDKDDESDVKYSVKKTDPVQVTYGTFLPLNSSSSPAPGHNDKKPVSHSGTGETQGTDWPFSSLISPIIDTPNVVGLNEPNWIPSWTPEELQQMQREDKSVKLILEYKLQNDSRPELPEEAKTDKTVKALWYQWESLCVKNCLLYREWVDSLGCTIYQLVTPDVIQKVIFDHLHSHVTAGHLGRDRTLESIRRRFYWPGVREDVERWIKSCDTCARVKPGPGRGKAALQQFKVSAIMQCVAIDIFGPLPISENGNEYIIVLGEYFSKWVEAWAVPNHTAQTVADKLVCEFFTKYGCPQQIHTDQGREFQSELFRILCKNFGIKQTRTAPYRPNSDGLVERFNRTLKQMLRSFAVENPQNWDDYLPYILMAYRATQNKSTGCTPNLVFLNREISCPLDLMIGPPPNTIDETCPVHYIEWVKSAMAITNDFVFRNIGQAAKRQKSDYDQGLKLRQYKKGDWVWRFYPPTANQKLNQGWTGPYLVLKCMSKVNYLIQRDPKKPVINVHIDDIKPYEGELTPTSWLNELEHTDTSVSQDKNHVEKDGYIDLSETESSELASHEIQSSEHTDPLDSMSNTSVLDDSIDKENTINSENDLTCTNLNTHTNSGQKGNQNELSSNESIRETLVPESDNGTLNECCRMKNKVRQNRMPVIRSRRERPIKPKEIWSPP